MKRLFSEPINFLLFPLKVLLNHHTVERMGLRSLRQERARACLPHIKAPFLDIGCGNNDLASHVIGGVGIDIMHASAAPNVYARAEGLPFKDGVFYAVTYIVSLRYASDLARALAEARRVLRKGGRIVVLENPPLQNWLRHHLTFWTRVEGEQCLGFTKKDIAELFAAARFSNIAVRRYLYGLGVIYIGEKQES